MPDATYPIGTRTELRSAFNAVAGLYDAMRPSYPEAVFDDVVQIGDFGDSSQALEIGCGTGHATQGIARRGLSVHAIELGENMAAVARERVANLPVTIEVADFDQWTTTRRFDLVYVASAFHWLNPETREARVASLLHEKGWLAIWRNRHIRNGSSDAFLDEAKIIYSKEAPQVLKRRAHLPGPEDAFQTDRDDLSLEYFLPPVQRHYFWSRPYTAAEYVQMLDTHSDHRLLPPENRSRLFDRIASLINTRYGGSVTKDYATFLRIAQRRA